MQSREKNEVGKRGFFGSGELEVRKKSLELES